jgi:fido (protein-threonine AMPylation protein)
MAVAQELETIEAIVADHPAGIDRPALEAAVAERLGKPIAWRTLLRRLDVLATESRVKPEGAARARVYRPGIGLVPGPPSQEPDYVPLSREGARVRALIRRPLIDRPWVGYREELLTSYRPGETWYLPRTTRTRLHELGRTTDGRRPAGTYARDILGRLLIDLAWASSRLEGNTYSRLDTKNLLEFGQRAEGKEVTEAQMILNHKAAIELLVEQAEQIGFNLFTFQNLHAALAENLLADPADEGRLRTTAVQIGGTNYQPPAIPQKIEELFRRLLITADAIPDPFEQAFFVMVHLPYVQPFIDVNKRTSRLGANIPLIKANLRPLSFIDVPEQAYVEGVLGVYELTRVELLRDVFVWAYERSAAQYHIVREAMGDPDPFRLRYRGPLADAVRDAVLTGAPPQAAIFRVWARAHAIPESDVDGFAAVGLELLIGMHEGALARYHLRPSEYEAWKSRYASTPGT